MTASFDVIVVGGGAVGAACARELAVSGRRVLVLDRDATGGEAWRAAAGMLAPQIEADAEDPLFDLGLAGRARYEFLAPELRERTGIDVGLWQEGIARLAADEDDVDVLRNRVAWQRQHGHVCDWLDADEVKARWPFTGPSAGALWAPREGALDPAKLVAALLADAEAHGATIVREPAAGLLRQAGRITGVEGRQRYAAGDVVVAAGAWSGRLEGLPRPLSVEPLRGQMAAAPWPAGAPRAILYHRDCYLVHRNGEAVMGSTEEYAGFRSETTPAGLAQILLAVSALCPALARQGVSRTWAGLRPVTPDGRPIIGREPTADGLWYATGHGRNGILLAAITGDLIRRMLDGETLEDRLDAVSPGRFWRW